MNNKYCKNCKYIKRSLLAIIFGDYAFAKCGHPLMLDIVSGKAKHSCELQRDKIFDEINLCGSTGKLWESK